MVLLSVKSIQGKREYMEDRYAYMEKNNITVAMVCDGHGGFHAAAATIKNLPHMIYNALLQPRNTNVKYAEAIRVVIMDWGKEIKGYHSGSTLTGIAIKDDIVYIYNVGDSRTCMQVKPTGFIYTLTPIFNDIGEFVERIHINYIQPQFFCTIDHDGELTTEAKRVNNAGGKIVNKRLNGILSVTRALGDTDVGPGLSSVPDVSWVKRSVVNGPILMYSDGIYEPQRYGKEEAFNDRYLYYLATKFNSEVLVNYAYNNGSDDNLTALLISVL